MGSTSGKSFMSCVSSCDSNVSRIEDHLYLSGKESAGNLHLRTDLKIKHILSVFNDTLSYNRETITYKKIVAEDYHHQDLLTYFPEANKFIGNAQQLKEDVLVHCHAGLSRSATIVLAFLMNKHQISYQSAVNLVKRNRDIYPNEGFVSQLKLYEDMGFTLNANNRELRKHIIYSFIEVWKADPHYEEYFKRRDYIEGMTQNVKLGQRCLCAQCGQHLFNEIHILKNDENMVDDNDMTREDCIWTFIEPQTWITQLFGPFKEIPDKITCPQCGEELIEYSKSVLINSCYCPQHYTLRSQCLRLRIPSDKFRIESNN